MMPSLSHLLAWAAVASAGPFHPRAVASLNEAATAEAHRRDNSATRAFSNVQIKTLDGKCLFVNKLSGDFRANLTPIQVAACGSTDGQGWDIITKGAHISGSNGMLIVSTLTQACFNFDPRRAAGNQVLLFSCGGRADGGGAVTDSQVFSFDGGAGPLSLKPRNQVGSCITVKGNVLDIASCKQGDAAQLFTVGGVPAAGAGNGATNGGTNTSTARAATTTRAAVNTATARGSSSTTCTTKRTQAAASSSAVPAQGKNSSSVRNGAATGGVTTKTKSKATKSTGNTTGTGTRGATSSSTTARVGVNTRSARTRSSSTSSTSTRAAANTNGTSARQTAATTTARTNTKLTTSSSRTTSTTRAGANTKAATSTTKAQANTKSKSKTSSRAPGISTSNPTTPVPVSRGGTLQPSAAAQAHRRDATATRAFSGVSIRDPNGLCLSIDPTAGDFRQNLIPVSLVECTGVANEKWDIVTRGKHNKGNGPAALVVSALTQGCISFDGRRKRGDTVTLFSCGGRADGTGQTNTGQQFPYIGQFSFAFAPVSERNTTCILPGNNGQLESGSCPTDGSQLFSIFP